MGSMCLQHVRSEEINWKVI